MVSIVVAFLCFTGFYHLLVGLPSVHLPQITTTLHQQWIPDQPVIVRNPLNESQWIRIDPLEQGELHRRAPPLKRYFWRNVILRPCDGTCSSPHKK